MGEKRIKDMYNEGASAFKKYEKTRNIEQFTNDAAEICKRYGHENDVCSLMIWWSARVNQIHQEYIRGAVHG